MTILWSFSYTSLVKFLAEYTAQSLYNKPPCNTILWLPNFFAMEFFKGILGK